MGLWTCGDIAVNRQRQPVPGTQTEKLCPNDTKGQDWYKHNGIFTD